MLIYNFFKLAHNVVCCMYIICVLYIKKKDYMREKKNDNALKYKG
jgi:hypothetical protein